MVFFGWSGIPPGGFTTRGNPDGIPVGTLLADGIGLEAVGSSMILDGMNCEIRLSVPVGRMVCGPDRGKEFSAREAAVVPTVGVIDGASVPVRVGGEVGPRDDAAVVVAPINVGKDPEGVDVTASAMGDEIVI